MELNLRKSDLKAALICAGTKDARTYLNGVHVEFQPNGDGEGILTFVGTNGRALFAGTAPAEFLSDAQSAPFWITIPADTVKAACKGKMACVTLASLPDGKYSLGDQIFAALDGRYPDFRRVIPQAKQSGEFAHFDFDLLAMGQSALREYFNSPKHTYALHSAGPNGSGVICGNSRDAVVVVMPMREPHAGAGEYSGTDIPAPIPEELRKAA